MESFPESKYAARSMFEIGNSYYMQEKFSVAVEALKQVLRKYSKDEYVVQTKFLMGECYVQLNQLQRAIGMFEGLKGKYPSPDVLELKIKEVNRRLAKAKRRKR